MGQADAQLRILHRNLFKIDGFRVFDETIRIPRHSGMEHDGLIILQAFFIDGIHHGIIGVKGLLGGVEL